MIMLSHRLHHTLTVHSKSGISQVGPTAIFFENSNKMLKINLGASNKKETLHTYVRNLFVINKSKLVNFRLLDDENYRIVRHQERYKVCYNFQEY